MSVWPKDLKSRNVEAKKQVENGYKKHPHLRKKHRRQFYPTVCSRSEQKKLAGSDMFTGFHSKQSLPFWSALTTYL